MDSLLSPTLILPGLYDGARLYSAQSGYESWPLTCRDHCHGLTHSVIYQLTFCLTDLFMVMVLITVCTLHLFLWYDLTQLLCNVINRTYLPYWKVELREQHIPCLSTENITIRKYWKRIIILSVCVCVCMF